MATAERDLLFGLLALQNGLIDQGQLVAGFQAWTRDRSRPLADHLAGRGDLDGDDRGAVEALVVRHLKKHGGDAGRSLAALPVGPSTRRSLAALSDPVIERTLPQIAPDPGPGAADRTASYAAGAGAADGPRFRVLRPHARGGLGAVFVALDAELHREVALKQILDHHADNPISRSRFLQEAEITGGLEHPGIVPVYGLGSYENGRPYYAMRFVRGDSLKEAADRFHADESLKKDPGRRSLELRQLLRRFTDVCNAIEYAHSRGVIHRDIKPANVIIGKHGETLVVDWGLAKAIGRSDPGVDPGERTLLPSSASGSAETLPGSAMGTPAYMSPEQAEGDLERLGPRSDVYSLGATLYYLLTGRPPFEGEIHEVIRAVSRGEFRPPRQVDPRIDPALEAACLKAIGLRPADRYRSPRALGEDIERWMADEPVSAWREPFARRARRWARRNRPAVAAVGAAVLAAVVGLAAVLAVQSRANAELRRADVESKARFELAREAIRSFYSGLSGEILRDDRLRPMRDGLLRSSGMYYHKLDDTMRGVTDGQTLLRMALDYRELASLLERIGNRSEAASAYAKEVDYRRALIDHPVSAPAAHVMELAEALDRKGLVANKVGDWRGALEAHEEAIRRIEPLATGPPSYPRARELLGLAVLRMGIVQYEVGKLGEALETFRRDEKIYAGLTRDFPLGVGSQNINNLVTCRGWIAEIHEATGKSEEALVDYRRGIDRLRSELGKKSSNDYTRLEIGYELSSIGRILGRTGRPDESIVAFREGLAIRERLIRKNPADTDLHHRIAESHEAIGNWLAAAGRPGEAVAEYRRAMEILRGLASADAQVLDYRESMADGLSALSASSAVLGRPDEAMAAAREALAIREALARNKPEAIQYPALVASSRRDVAALLTAAGRPDEARAEAEKARAAFETAAAAEPDVSAYRDGLAGALSAAGDALRDLGRRDEARDHYARAVALREALSAAEPTVTIFRSGLASALRRLAQVKRAGEDIAGASTDAGRAVHLIEGLPPRSGLDWVELACARAIPAVDDPGTEPGPALAALREAAARGYRDRDALRREPALMLLRDRDDFRALMSDLAFPADPFAAPP